MDWTEIANRYGLIGIIILTLVLNGEKVLAGITAAITAIAKVLAPPFADWLKTRAKPKGGKNGQAAILEHVIASDTRGEMTQVSLIERMLGTLENSLERMWQDREKTSVALDNVHAQLSELRAVVARHNDILGVHGQNVAHLADRMTGVEVQIASANGKLDSLGAWSGEMQSLRREVSG